MHNSEQIIALHTLNGMIYDMYFNEAVFKEVYDMQKTQSIRKVEIEKYRLSFLSLTLWKHTLLCEFWIF